MKIKDKITETAKRNKCIFAAFLLPVLLMITAFAAEGIYPFGQQQIAVIDMYHQYVPFLSELQNKLHEGGSLFFTWNGAGGSDFLTLLAYYGASPLNLLLIIFPENFIMEGITVILLIKIGLSGSFMAMFLRYIYRTCDMGTVAFAVLYALNSYVMAYYWCIMWMDAVMLLPLVIMGLHKIIDEGKFVQYTVTLALTIIINYYMAIMVCIFIMFYYPVLYFIKVRGGGLRRCAVTTGKAVGFSLLGVTMSAVLLLPTYISMQNTFYISSDMPENWLVYNDPLDIVNQLLPNAHLTFRDGLPNLYCGLIVVMLLVFYVVSKTIPLREKSLNICFLVFMFFSLNLNKLDFIWHGFHFPNQLPYRYTFVICFILIGMAYKVFLKIDEVKTNAVWGVLGAGIGYYLLMQKILEKEIDNLNLYFYGGIAWLLLYCLIIVLYKKGYVKKTIFIFLIMVVVISEMASNTCTSIEKIGTTSRDTYFSNREDMVALAEETKKEFVRTEVDNEYLLNCPAMYHYRGISQFSSSINADTTAFMEKIGVEGSPGKNRFNYNQTAPIVNAMLGIKYIISKNVPLEDDDFTLVKKKGYSRLYQSKYPLSVGYMVSDTIRTWNYSDDNPFDVINDYVRCVTDNSEQKIFVNTGEPEILSSNVEISRKDSDNLSGALKDTGRKSKILLRYKAGETRKYYLFIEADSASEIVVKKGDSINDTEIRNDCGSIVNIGEVKKGQTFDVEIDYKAKSMGSVNSRVCYMDEAVWEKVYGLLSESMLDVYESDDTHVRGTIDVKKSGTCILSVPYEKGWQLKIDGQTRKINEQTGGCFISTSLSEGTHEVELTYKSPGLAVGLLITLLSIAVMLSCVLVRRLSSAREKSDRR